MPDQVSLATSRTDVVAAVGRAAASGVPVVGGVIAEVVTAIISNQKLDRVVVFLEALAQLAEQLRERQGILEERLRGSEGSDLLEEGIVQASRSVSAQRQRRVAKIVVTGVAEEELKYDRTKTLLAIHESLTDSEFLLLYYYSRTPILGSQWHQELQLRYPEVLRPVSRAINASEEEIDRCAFRDRYEGVLLGHGLLEAEHGLVRITPLGRRRLKYAGEENAESLVVAS